MTSSSVAPGHLQQDAVEEKPVQWSFRRILPVAFVLIAVVLVIVLMNEGGNEEISDEVIIIDDNDEEPPVVVVQCDPGFEPDPVPDSGFDCIDINECRLDIDGCNTSHHWCRNFPGSFACMECEEAGQVVAEGGRGCVMPAETEDFIEEYVECPADTETGGVMNKYLIGSVEGTFLGAMGNDARFGISVTVVRDLDRDGVKDLAVGAWMDGGGGIERGAVFVLRMNGNGGVKAEQKISSVDGGLQSTLVNYERFGKSVAGIGDLDGDGIGDLVVVSHAPEALYILFLEPSGYLKGQRKISTLENEMNKGEDFGKGLAGLGDLDNDGVPDVAVGIPRADEERGAILLLFLNEDGTVKSERKIGFSSSQLANELDFGDAFGSSITVIGDLDGNGALDIAVGAVHDDDGGNNRGSVYILFFNPDATVKEKNKISSTRGNFAPEYAIALKDGNSFGYVGKAGDMDGDGLMDLFVGAIHDSDDSVDSTGALWVLMLNSDGTVKDERKISRRVQDMTRLEDGYLFGMSPTALDYLGDGILQVAVGMPGRSSGSQDEEGTSIGALYLLEILACTPPGDVDECALGEDNCTPLTHVCRNTEGSFECIECGSGLIESEDGLSCIPADGDINECVRNLDECGASQSCRNTEGSYECVDCGAGEIVSEDADSCIPDPCAAQPPVCPERETCVTTGYTSTSYMCHDFCTSPGKYTSVSKINYESGGLTASVTTGDMFAKSVAVLGDIDGDGEMDLAVSAIHDDDAGSSAGAIYIVFLNRHHTLKAENKITGSQGANYRFGHSLAALGDVDGDGVSDLAAGTPTDPETLEKGAVFIIFLTSRGERKREVKISTMHGGLKWRPDERGGNYQLGAALAAVGDLDQDGVVDMIVGAHDDGNAEGRGFVLVVYLYADGSVKNDVTIGYEKGGFGVGLAMDDHFGSSVAAIGDVDGDDVIDLVVGAPGDRLYRGAVYVVLLNRDGTVKEKHLISSTSGGLVGPLEEGDAFGSAVSAAGDLNNDGVVDLLVAAKSDRAGAVYVLLMKDFANVRSEYKLEGRVIDPIITGGVEFGSGITYLGYPQDGNVVMDMVVGVPNAPGGGTLVIIKVPRGYVAECPSE